MPQIRSEDLSFATQPFCGEPHHPLARVEGDHSRPLSDQEFGVDAGAANGVENPVALDLPQQQKHGGPLVVGVVGLARREYRVGIRECFIGVESNRLGVFDTKYPRIDRAVPDTSTPVSCVCGTPPFLPFTSAPA